jgi:hypothetical protein
MQPARSARPHSELGKRMLHPDEGGSTATDLCSRDAHRWCAPPQAVLLSKFAIFSAGTHFFVMKVISKKFHFSSSFERNPQYVKSTQHWKLHPNRMVGSTKT